MISTRRLLQWRLGAGAAAGDWVGILQQSQWQLQGQQQHD